jgi:hypothetical protein
MRSFGFISFFIFKFDLLGCALDLASSCRSLTIDACRLESHHHARRNTCDGDLRRHISRDHGTRANNGMRSDCQPWQNGRVDADIGVILDYNTSGK